MYQGNGTVRMVVPFQSVPVAPFILNYSGALLRHYPGPWQVMIKQSDGSYACVAEAAARFTLGEVSTGLALCFGKSLPCRADSCFQPRPVHVDQHEGRLTSCFGIKTSS